MIVIVKMIKMKNSVLHTLALGARNFDYNTCKYLERKIKHVWKKL